MRIAAYARYSSDSQREASIEDQLRNCRARCLREGWPAPEVLADSAMSGMRHDRPAYQRLLAEAHRFDVILVDDLSRFGRDKEEVGRAVKRLTFAGVRLVGVSDGVDTARRGHKVDVGLRGLMSELYLDDLADKTHRGLTGRALAGASAGGLPYGYVVTETGQRAVTPDQAVVVRRIFDAYLSGQSARAIAAGLNADRIPSPRGSTWAPSAIFGDWRRGIGILANPIYVGRQVWNKSRWVKHPESGRRVRQERPEAEWVTTDQPELAIVDLVTWDAVQARLRGRGTDAQLQAGQRRGRVVRNLLSGILRCGECSGPFVVVDAYKYGCANAKERGTCTSTIRVDRRAAERAMLAGVRERLMSEENFRDFQRDVAAMLKQAAPDTDRAQRAHAAAERELENILAAIRAGILTSSTKAELLKAEAAVAQTGSALAAARAFQPSAMLPRARDVFQRLADELDVHSRNVQAVRVPLQMLLGGRAVVLRNENGDPIAQVADSQITMVAGAGFGSYLRGPWTVALR